MATRRHHNNFDAAEFASEELDAPEWTCSRCNTDNGKTTAATAYCQDCNHGYCASCLEIHASFPGMKTHQITTIYVTRRSDSRGVNERASRGSSQTMARPDRTNQTMLCHDHDDQTLSIFCGDHGAVCCPVCVAMNHSVCKDKGYIPKISTGVADSPEYLDTQKAIQITQKDTDAVLDTLEQSQDKLNGSKELVTEAIRDIKREIVELFGGLEDDALLDIGKQSSTIENKLGVATNLAKDVNSQLQTLSETLQPGDDISESELFVNMKRCQQNVKDAQSLIKNVSEAAKGCEIRFTEKPFIQKIRGLSSLGKVDIGK